MGTQCPSPAPPTRTGYSEPPSELWDNTLFQSGPFWYAAVCCCVSCQKPRPQDVRLTVRACVLSSGPRWRNRTPAKFPACSIAITTLGCGLKHIGAVFSVDEVKVPSAVFREDAVYNFLDVLLGRCPCSVQVHYWLVPVRFDSVWLYSPSVPFYAWVWVWVRLVGADCTQL